MSFAIIVFPVHYLQFVCIIHHVWAYNTACFHNNLQTKNLRMRLYNFRKQNWLAYFRFSSLEKNHFQIHRPISLTARNISFDVNERCVKHKEIRTAHRPRAGSLRQASQYQCAKACSSHAFRRLVHVIHVFDSNLTTWRDHLTSSSATRLLRRYRFLRSTCRVCIEYQFLNSTKWTKLCVDIKHLSARIFEFLHRLYNYVMICMHLKF